MSRMDITPVDEPADLPSPSEDGEALVAAAEARRRQVRSPAPAALPPSTRRRRRPAEGPDAAAEPAAEAVPATTRRRKVKREVPPDAGRRSSASGTHIPPDPVHKALKALGPWGWSAVASLAALSILACLALAWRPAPAPVAGVSIDWMPGPRVSQKEFLSWLRAFPHRDQLPEANDWVLERLAEYLRELPAVDRLRRISLGMQPDERGGASRRVVCVELGLRQPEMPAVLASGERAWVDAEGNLMPGSLPAPARRRPVLRQVEAGGRSGLRSALALWRLLEPSIEPGLVTDILLDEPMDERGAKGVVLRTRQGAALIWGRPDDERFGVRPEDKARELLRTLRGQGDLGRIAQINVRFREPFFLLRP